MNKLFHIFNNYIKGKELERYFSLNDALFAFHEPFRYDYGDDRSIVIIGGSFLDIILEHLLLAFFPEDNSEIKILFQNNQPLGSFSNKVRIAYSLGLIDEVIKDDLKIIAKIRHQFAQDLYASFENQNVGECCKQLKWHRISMMSQPPSKATVRDYYQVGVNQLIIYLNGAVSIARNQKRIIKNDFQKDLQNLNILH